MLAIARPLGRRSDAPVRRGWFSSLRRLRGFGLVGLMGLIGLVVSLLCGAGAGAQSSVTLASNIGQTDDPNTFGFGHEYAQAFTTRSHEAGYKLTQLKLDVTVGSPSGLQPTYDIELWSINSSSKPATKLVTLNNPTSITTGRNTWTFPNGGYDVNRRTSYVILWDVHNPVGSISAAFHTTASNNEDSGSWSIANQALQKGKNAPWSSATSVDRALQIQIVGYKNSTPAAVAPPPPDPPNLARGDIQPSGSGGTQVAPVISARAGLLGSVSGQAEPGRRSGIHQVPTRMGEIRSNQPVDASGTLDLRAISESVSAELRRYSRGFYLTVMVERVSGQRHLFRSGTAVDAGGRRYELARGAPLLQVKIWHVYHHAGRGMNSIELLGEVFGGRLGDRLVEPVEICLPAPARDVERAQIAVRGRLDRHWTILDSNLTFDGQICAQTTRVSWFTIVLEPEAEGTLA